MSDDEDVRIRSFQISTNRNFVDNDILSQLHQKESLVDLLLTYQAM